MLLPYGYHAHIGTGTSYWYGYMRKNAEMVQLAVYVKRVDMPLVLAAAGKEGIGPWLRMLAFERIREMRKAGQLPPA